MNSKILDDHLYMSYTDLMAESCHTGDDDEDQVDGGREDVEDENVEEEEEEKSFEVWKNEQNCDLFLKIVLLGARKRETKTFVWTKKACNSRCRGNGVKYFKCKLRWNIRHN